MAMFLRILSKMPFSKPTRIGWRRALIDKLYAVDISAAYKRNDHAAVEHLKSDRRYEIQMLDDEEDEYISKKLVKEARKLRVKIPHISTPNENDLKYWYQSDFTGRFNLTSLGISTLRTEIRNEIKSRHEMRAQWVVWLSAITGIVGALTGLVAVVVEKIN